MRRLAFAFSVALACAVALPSIGAPSIVYADEEEQTPEVHPRHRIARRQVPDYDGRPDAPRPIEDVVLDLPRVVLFPLYLLVEYVVRQPIGFLMTTAEREQWDLFRYLPISDEPLPWGIIPTAFIDFGFLPSLGLFLWFDHALVEDNHVSVQIGFGGPDWLRGTLVDRFPIAEGAVVELKVDGWQRPDYLYMGLGPYARPDRITRYGRRNLDGMAELRIRPFRSSQIRIVLGVSANELYDTSVNEDDEQSLSEGIARGWFPDYPPGFRTGYVAYFQRLELALDTRQSAPEATGGVRVEVHGELGVDINAPLARQWLLWGGALGGYVDVASGRTLGAWGTAELATPTGTEPVPFTELSDLGAMGRMPGFRNGWVVGESALAFGVDYAFPVAPWLDGFVVVSCGNAFGRHFDGLDAGLFRMSYAIGVRAGNPDQPFVVQAGMGTASFDDGGGPQVFRLTFGSQPGGL
jgi:hypothetical protein